MTATGVVIHVVPLVVEQTTQICRIVPTFCGTYHLGMITYNERHLCLAIRHNFFMIAFRIEDADALIDVRRQVGIVHLPIFQYVRHVPGFGIVVADAWGADIVEIEDGDRRPEAFHQNLSTGVAVDFNAVGNGLCFVFRVFFIIIAPEGVVFFIPFFGSCKIPPSCARPLSNLLPCQNFGGKFFPTLFLLHLPICLNAIE
mmetsp:Transcript_33810/g.78079  ORF Transcript_33810/g.78079 Transcript_33810/m.78079 type:complete len:200 (+) Transcript_33810:652-1251(+)